MEAAKPRELDDLVAGDGWLDGSAVGRVAGERGMASVGVVMGLVSEEEPASVFLPEHDDAVEEVAADGADDALAGGVFIAVPPVPTSTAALLMSAAGRIGRR